MGFFEDVVKRNLKGRKEAKDALMSCVAMANMNGRIHWYTRTHDPQYPAIAIWVLQPQMPFSRKNIDDFVSAEPEQWDNIDDKGNVKRNHRIPLKFILKDLAQTEIFKKNNSYSRVSFEPFPPWTDPTADRNLLNRFTGWPCRLTQLGDEAQRRIDVWLNLLDELVNYDKAAYAYVQYWLASIIQRPGQKPRTSLAFVGIQGVGKGLFWTEFVGRLIFGPWYLEVQSWDALLGRFNKDLENRLIINANELPAYVGSVKSKKDFQKLKALITDNTITITPKGVDPYTAKFPTGIVMMSNNRDALLIEPSDRRAVVFECSESRAQDSEYFKQMASCLTQEHANAFFTHLAQLDVSQWDPHQRPDSQLRRVMQYNSLKPHIQFMVNLTLQQLPGINKQPRFRVHADTLHGWFKKWISTEQIQLTADTKRLLGPKAFSRAIREDLKLVTRNIAIESQSRKGFDLSWEELEKTIATFVRAPSLQKAFGHIFESCEDKDVEPHITA